MILDPLGKTLRPTVPLDTKDPPRFGQPVETVKDALILEFKDYLNRANQSDSRVQELPNVRKFDFSYRPRDTSLRTAVNIIRKMPNIKEQLPLIAVLGASTKNRFMGLSGAQMATVMPDVAVTTSLIEPFALADGQTLQYQTTTPQGQTRVSEMVFRSSRFPDISHASAQRVAEEINLQAARGRASATPTGGISLAFGGPCDQGNQGDILIIGGTALPALGFVVGQQALYSSVTPYLRRIQASAVSVGMEVAAEDDNVRTELTDLVYSFLSYVMDDRAYTLFGRATFASDPTLYPSETYQIILNNEIGISGESEVPRPGDDVNKIYLNRIDLSVHIFQYSDRAVVVPGSNPTTGYINRGGQDILRSDLIPLRN